MNVLFVDTETTCKDPEVTEICEIACLLYQFDGLTPVNRLREFESLVKPSVPITYEAMGTHHITEEDVQDAPTAAEICAPVLDIAREANFICAHNLPFDLEIMKRTFPGLGFDLDSGIDTLRLARHAFQDLPSYSLQALRYRFKLDSLVDGPREAHRAGFDTRLVLALLARIIGTYSSNPSIALPFVLEGIGDFVDWSSSPIEVKTFNFGKYYSQSTYYVCKKDPRYIQWILGNPGMRKDRPDLCATLERYMGYGKTKDLPL